MVDHNTETSTDISKPVMQTDFLVCGRCQRKFTLSSLQAFIQHKLFDCQGVSLEGMECQSCPEKFQTPWSLIRHAQNTHALKIFLEEGPYGEGISSVNDDPVDQERLGDLGIQLPENTSQISMREDAQVVLNIEDTTDGRTLPVILKPSTELCEQQTAVIPHVSTHRIVTGISNVTTQATPQVLFNSSSANVVAPVQVVAIKPMNTVAKDPTATLSTTCSPSSNNCVLMPLGEKPNNRHPVLTATLGVVEKVLPVSLGVGSRLQSVLRTPGAHSISVLQPIKLPPGALLGTSLCMNNASQPSMTFTMLPLGLPQSQAKTSLVQIQKDAGRRPSLQKAEDNVDSNSQLVLPVTFHVSTTSDIAGASTVLPHLAEDSSCPPSRDGARMILKEDLAATSGLRATVVASELATVQDSSPQIQVVTQSSSVQNVSDCATVTESSKHDNLAEACACPCCKVGKCMRGIGKLGLKESDSNPCPCGPIITSVSSPKVLQNSAVPCSDATTQSDLKRRKRKDSKGIQKEDAFCTDNSICCCDNQDCGVTIMPGTHEGLKKCCNAVVPKKRKRHMETKHQIKKHRAAAAAAAAAEPSFSAEPNTIYINIQSTPAIPQGSSSVAGELRLSAPVGTQGAITVNTSTAGLTSNSSTMDVNPSSLTLSIPVVSYTHQSSCSAGNCARPAGVNNTDCGCGCCPGPRKLQYTSLRDKKLKTSRRLSASSLEAQKEFLVAQAIKQGAMDLAAGVKTEALNGRVDGDQTTNERLLGQRKMLRPTMRTNVVGKKRRYPTSRPFKCDQCDHAFNQRIHLKKHLSKHTGIKPFKCEQCDYSTVERSHLKVHIRVHTGEKPYKCSCCEYATAQNSTLKIHLKRHHGDGGADDGGGEDGSGGSHAPFSCPVCGLEFEDEASLLQHQLQHSPATNAGGGGGDDVTASKSASAGAKQEGGAVEARTKGSGKGPTGLPTLTVSL